MPISMDSEISKKNEFFGKEQINTFEMESSGERNEVKIEKKHCYTFVTLPSSTIFSYFSREMNLLLFNQTRVAKKLL